MNHLFYPAVFHSEDVGYSVYIPNIPGCISEGDTLEDAYAGIIDALGLCLEEYAANNENPPAASAPHKVNYDDGDFIVLIEFDLLAYKKKHDNRAVKKTLSIPSWLNALAEEQHVNFSSVLQAALKQQLNID